jgi:ABC-type multidrug transport system ATPase subunit
VPFCLFVGIENKKNTKKMDHDDDDQQDHNSSLASSSFRTPSRGKASSSLLQQQQQQQPYPLADDVPEPPPPPPLPPSSWRKRMADRWGNTNNSGAPASSFFMRQRSSIGPDDNTGGGGGGVTRTPSRTMTTTMQRSDHLSRLILRQALSRRLLSSYTTTEIDNDDDDDRVLVGDDADDEEEGIEIMAPTPRMSNSHTSTTTGHDVGSGTTTLLQHSSYTLRGVENDIMSEEDDDDTDHHYTADDVEQMRKSVLIEEAVSHRLQYVHSLVQSSFIMVAPLEVKLYNVTIAVPNSIDNSNSTGGADGPSSSSSRWHHHGHRHRRSNKIKTVYNTSCLYPIIKRLKHSFTGELRHDTNGPPTRPSSSSSSRRHTGPSSSTALTTTTQYLLQDINLCLTPGTQYLVLGAPGSGKTSLLKAIAGLLLPTTTTTTATTTDDEVEEATWHLQNNNNNNNNNNNHNIITYNDRMLTDGDYYIRNAVSYIASTDWHATRLTVNETLAFAYQCLHGPRATGSLPPAIQLALATLGLEDVFDRYVGGDTAVRGISGGQRRRVSIGELLMGQAPVLCGDEITTGLDASGAYDMLQVILHYSRLQQQTKILVLLQPSPEMVSLFDEIIVLCEAQIIYAGKLENVERYFSGIGYRCPEFMDIADFLTMVGNCPDHYYHDRTTTTTTTATATTTTQSPDNGDGGTTAATTAPPPQTPTASQLAELFRQSSLGQTILDNLAGPSQYVFTQREVLNNSRHDGSVISKLADSRFVNRRYANSFARSTLLIARRFLTLYVRDRRVLIAGAVKNILMGVSVGGVFFNTTDPLSIHGRPVSSSCSVRCKIPRLCCTTG